jgi:hypothetical protein
MAVQELSCNLARLSRLEGVAAMQIKSLAIAFAILSFAGPAMANCYEGIGCTDSEYFTKRDLRELSCQALWDVRNTIYKDNGYCFSTKKAISYFGNKGCTTKDMGAVRLNTYERENVAQIASVEKSEGCN